MSVQAPPRRARGSSPGRYRRDGPLRIALISPVWYPVPPPRYGGTEAVVALLADGLVAAGHDVTLFASGDSETKASLSSTYDRAPTERIGQALPELHHCLACYERAGEFDVINDHSGLPAAAIGGLLETPVLHTVHGPLDGEGGRIYERIARTTPRLGLISLSLSQRRPRPDLPWVANCPNAIDPSLYPWTKRRGDYLLFLGRMGHNKGAHRAIAVAREAGLPLKIAAKCREPAEIRYFREFVEPHLDDRIEYVGEVGGDDKVELLQGARATLFPIDWEEPFGLVMIESMACGTPVIATRRGAVPEVIEHGRTGIVVDDYREMAAALELADALDPIELRRAVGERFSPQRMVADYVNAFRATLTRPRPRSDRTWLSSSKHSMAGVTPMHTALHD
jgi:glycosyltransferase involved in cell wall biosynthesis